MNRYNGIWSTLVLLAEFKGSRFSNWIVLGCYLAVLVGVGIYFAKREKSTHDFFLAGRRIPWWAAGLSIFGTQLSAITYLAMPARAYATDWSLLPLNSIRPTDYTLSNHEKRAGNPSAGCQPLEQYWAFRFFLRWPTGRGPRFLLRSAPHRKCEHRRSGRRSRYWARQLGPETLAETFAAFRVYVVALRACFAKSVV